MLDKEVGFGRISHGRLLRSRLTLLIFVNSIEYLVNRVSSIQYPASLTSNHVQIIWLNYKHIIGDCTKKID